MKFSCINVPAMAFYKFLFIGLIFFLVTGCQKEISHDEGRTTIKITLPEKTHREKIQTWLKSFPLKGTFTGIDFTNIKTIFINDHLVTRIPVGKTGSSLYLLSSKNKFHVYGITNSDLKTQGGRKGIVKIYDFQTLTKTGVRYENGSITSFLKYGNNTSVINAYTGIYPKCSGSAREHARTAVEGGLISAIRKFFCELFGGTWYADVAGNASSPGGSCSTGGTGEDEVQELPPPEAGGTDLGLIWFHLNDPDFFNESSTVWGNIIDGLSGGGDMSWAASTGSNLDPAFTDPEVVRSLYYILNTQYNQQVAGPYDGSLADILDYFSYPANGQQYVPLTTFILKAGANGAADAFGQIELLNEINSISTTYSYVDALASPYFSKQQVIASSTGGLIEWKFSETNIDQAVADALTKILANLVDGKYLPTDYNTIGGDFSSEFKTKFFTPLSIINDIITQTAINKAENPDWPAWKCYWEAVKEVIHFGLDAAGMVPVVGEGFDILNGLLYTLEGDGTNATLSLVSAIPVVGWFSSGAKWAFKTVQLANGTKTTLKWIRGAGDVISFGNRGQLRRVLGLAKGDSRIAHHIIPWEKATHPAIQKAAKAGDPFHLNELFNGIPLDQAVHSGNHAAYLARVQARLDAIPTSLNPQQTKTAIEQIITDIRAAMAANPNTHIDYLVF